MKPRVTAAHADWSVAPRKRWVAIAKPEGRGWRIGLPEPVGTVASFLERLVAIASGGPVALGIDAPIGVPRAFAAALPDADFPAFLRRIASHPDFFRVAATLEELTPHRPFYPARGMRGMTRLAHARAIGLGCADDLCRACDRATLERPAGAPPFWTLGANQTGKAAIVAWRDLLAPALEMGGLVRLWPFEGAFRSLLGAGSVAVAETYPAEALRQLGLVLRGGKRSRDVRARLGPELVATLHRCGAHASPELAAHIADGFGPDAAGEDRFDCVLGLLCVLNVLSGGRPDTAPQDEAIFRWEGWVLGQTALPRIVAKRAGLGQQSDSGAVLTGPPVREAVE